MCLIKRLVVDLAQSVLMKLLRIVVIVIVVEEVFISAQISYVYYRFLRFYDSRWICVCEKERERAL